eukprot:TRINITY_DN2266_c0_g1_i1.p1 TRINITY_DN2266_c0_g1~~TRINITY_DN2266_c0_g1_i1.p1  ORF type:complete len:350 (+),score=116.30 TRINITY_DN2266_c0_g1_i1:57-1106(+)
MSELDDLLDSVLEEFEDVLPAKSTTEPVVIVESDISEIQRVTVQDGSVLSSKAYVEEVTAEVELKEYDQDDSAERGVVVENRQEERPSEDQLEKQLQELLKELGNSNFAKSLENNDNSDGQVMPSDDELRVMESFFKQFAETLSNNNGGANNINNNSSAANVPPPKSFDESLEAAMKMISEGAQEIKPDSEAAGDDEFLEKLLEQFKGMDPNDQSSMDKMVETMMAEMLSKETLYPPIKHIVSLYPEYLEKHREDLKTEDLSQYEKQFECFSHILRLLDESDAESAENKRKIMNLLTEVQEYGTPPKEVLSELMPGLQFDEEGNPKVSEGLPGMDNELFTATNGQCQIM